MTSFRLAYHLIKQWTVERGIYSAKFGYFGGIHLTLMLSWVCKRLAHDCGLVSAGDLILSFFQYYANFDWQNDMVYDAFFHKKKPRYQRSAREAMVILGFHAPNSNIAHTATVPGMQVLVNELRQADARLTSQDMTWDAFLDADGAGSKLAVANFLSSFDSYVKIDIQYWGRTLSRGKGLVGWIESRCINLIVGRSLMLSYGFPNSRIQISTKLYRSCHPVSGRRASRTVTRTPQRSITTVVISSACHETAKIL